MSQRPKKVHSACSKNCSELLFYARRENKKPWTIDQALDLAGSSPKFVDTHHLAHYSLYQRKCLLLIIRKAGCNGHHSCDHKTSIRLKGERNCRQDPFYEGRVQINLQALDI